VAGRGSCGGSSSRATFAGGARRRPPLFLLPFRRPLCCWRGWGAEGEAADVYRFCLPAGGVVVGVGYVVPGFSAEELRQVFPDGDGEAAASSALGNKSLRPRPCCSGAHSGAGARSVRVEPPVPGVELLCWRQRPAFYRPGRKLSTLAFWFEDAAAAVGPANGRRVDRARVLPPMVDDELWSKIVGAWGAAPVDGLSAMPLSHPFG